MRFSDFQDKLLLAIGTAARDLRSNVLVDAKKAAEEAGLEFRGGWVDDAARALQYLGYVKARPSAQTVHVLLTGKGWDAYQDLLDAAEETVSEPTVTVPASDRVVRLDHNSSDYLEAVEKLTEAVAAVRFNNEFAESDPEEHEQLIAELESGQRLLQARQVRVEAVTAVLLKPLRWLGVKFAEGLVGSAAQAAYAALTKLAGSL